MLITLRRGDVEASIDPCGGRLLGLERAGRAYLAGHQDPDGPDAYRGALLAPWPNRLADGVWEWQGRRCVVPINDPESGSALHGLVAHRDFMVTNRSDHSVQLTCELEPTAGYPFSLSIGASYALTSKGIDCTLEAVNTGAERAPVGLGVHPYVLAAGLIDELTVTIPASSVTQLDPQWIQTGESSVVDAGLDFRHPRLWGSTALDSAFTDLIRDDSGRIEVVVQYPDGDRLVLWSGVTCRWLVVYTSDRLGPQDRRRSMAIEPMTCPANALRSGVDLEVLQPGETLVLDWGFCWDVQEPA